MVLVHNVGWSETVNVWWEAQVVVDMDLYFPYKGTIYTVTILLQQLLLYAIVTIILSNKTLGLYFYILLIWNYML